VEAGNQEVAAILAAAPSQVGVVAAPSQVVAVGVIHQVLPHLQTLQAVAILKGNQEVAAFLEAAPSQVAEAGVIRQRPPHRGHLPKEIQEVGSPSQVGASLLALAVEAHLCFGNP